jgi:tetratricopeptide (TPR) repeat protein
MCYALLVIGLYLLCAGTAFAQNIGDTVIVIRVCEIKVGNAVVSRATPGEFLTVNDINDKWLWVENGIPGWIDSENTTSVDEAVPYFTEIIRQFPVAESYGARGLVWRAQHEYDHAIIDFSEAIRLRPTEAAYYVNRGGCWNRKREWERAIADFSEAIRLKPHYGSYNNRGRSWLGKKEYGRALTDYDEAIRLEPKSSQSHIGAAWIRATCPDAKYRDGLRAVQDATTGCKLNSWKDAGEIATLAAACAEAGDFDEAVKWQEKALQMVPESQKRELQEGLALYLSRKPFRYESSE